MNVFARLLFVLFCGYYYPAIYPVMKNAVTRMVSSPWTFDDSHRAQVTSPSHVRSTKSYSVSDHKSIGTEKDVALLANIRFNKRKFLSKPFIKRYHIDDMLRADSTDTVGRKPRIRKSPEEAGSSSRVPFHT